MDLQGSAFQTGVLPYKVPIYGVLPGIGGFGVFCLGIGGLAGIWELGSGIWELGSGICGWDLWLAWVSDSDFGSAWPYTDLVSAG